MYKRKIEIQINYIGNKKDNLFKKIRLKMYYGILSGLKLTNWNRFKYNSDHEDWSRQILLCAIKPCGKSSHIVIHLYMHREFMSPFEVDTNRNGWIISFENNHTSKVHSEFAILKGEKNLRLQ